MKVVGGRLLIFFCLFRCLLFLALFSLISLSFYFYYKKSDFILLLKRHQQVLAHFKLPVLWARSFSPSGHPPSHPRPTSHPGTSLHIKKVKVVPFINYIQKCTGAWHMQWILVYLMFKEFTVQEARGHG